jgi:hypothetical protein
MKRLPFDDPGAYRRRWSHLSTDQLQAEARRNPLLFAADHLPVEDRREGAVVIVAELRDTPEHVVVVIPDGPPAPEEEMCLGVLANVIAQLDAAVNEAAPYNDCCGYCDYRDDSDVHDCIGESSVQRLGVVAHRLGSSAISDVDRRWTRALGLVSVALGIDTIGVLARTRSGELVHVPESAAA